MDQKDWFISKNGSYHYGSYHWFIQMVHQLGASVGFMSFLVGTILAKLTSDRPGRRPTRSSCGSCGNSCSNGKKSWRRPYTKGLDALEWLPLKRHNLWKVIEKTYMEMRIVQTLVQNWRNIWEIWLVKISNQVEKNAYEMKWNSYYLIM